MGVRFVIIISFLLLTACHSNTPCDPSKPLETLGGSGSLSFKSADCPNSEPICDPAGICRSQCASNAECASGLVCDQSGTNSQKTGICQPSCSNGEACLEGEACFTPNITVPQGDDKLPSMCKKICFNTAEDFCNPTNAVSCQTLVGTAPGRVCIPTPQKTSVP